MVSETEGLLNNVILVRIYLYVCRFRKPQDMRKEVYRAYDVCLNFCLQYSIETFLFPINI
jgi:hypothetical protein